MTDVERSDSQRSDRNRCVSFNRNVHVKRIVPVNKPKSAKAISCIGNGSYVTLPLRREKHKRFTKSDVDTEAKKVLEQIDKAERIGENYQNPSEQFKYNTLPPRLRKETESTATETVPERPPRLFQRRKKQQKAQDNQQSADNRTEPLTVDINSAQKRSNLHRSKSDATPRSIKSSENIETKTDNDRQPDRFRKRSDTNPEKSTKWKPLTPIDEEEAKLQTGSVTNFIKDYINEIDRESYDLSRIQENSEAVLDNMIRSEGDRQKSGNQIIYAQVVCNKNKPFAKKETVHMTLPKVIHSSDSDEGLGGCRDPKRKAYIIRFGDEVDRSSQQSQNLSEDREELIEPKVRNFEPKRFFDTVELDRGQADGMDSKFDQYEPDPNDLLTISNLRKRNELSERRNLLENRINSRSWSQLRLKEFDSVGDLSPKDAEVDRDRESMGYVEKYVREMKAADRSGGNSSEFHTYMKYANDIDNGYEMHEDKSTKLNRYKSNPELVRKRGQSDNEDYEYDDEFLEDDDEYNEQIYRNGDKIRIVQTKSLQNLSKKISDESEDEGFASSIMISNDKQRSFEKSNRKETKDEFKVKKSGFQKVKQLFTRDNGKKKKVTNGKFVQYERNADSDHLNEEEYRSRSRFSTPNRQNDDAVGLSKSKTKTATTASNWFKSLDRLTRRRQHQKQSHHHHQSQYQQPKQQRYHCYSNGKEEKENIVLNESHQPQLKKNLRFFGDADIEPQSQTSYPPQPPVRNRHQELQTKHRPPTTNSTSSTSSNYRFQQNDKMKSQSYRDLKNSQRETSDDDGFRHKSLCRNQQQSRGMNKSMQNLQYVKNGHSHEPQSFTASKRYEQHSNGGSSSTEEADNSQHSQRSVVYLHAATIGDIPDPNEMHRLSRRSQSRESLSSTLLQPRVKTVSRSFSLLAPWRPRVRDPKSIEYNNGMQPRPVPAPVPNRYAKRSQSKSRNEHAAYESSGQNGRRKGNGSHSDAFKRSGSSSRNGVGSTTTLYKKKERQTGDNCSRYDRNNHRIVGKTVSIESF